MFRSLKLKTIGARFLMVVTLLAIFAILLVPRASAQATTWTITIDATGSSSNPGYSVSPTTGGCPFTLKQNPENLAVCPGDKIVWQLMSTEKLSELYLYHEDAILLDPNTNSPHGVQASNDNPSLTYTVKSNPSLQGPHKYYVAALDKKTARLYVADPKVIIGQGSPIELLDQIQTACKPLLGSLEDNSKAKDQAKAMCAQVQQIKNLLK